PSVTPEAVAEALATWGRPFRHIRVIADLSASAPTPDCLWQEPTSLVALHDLAFLALQSGFDRLSEEGASFVGLFVDAMPSGNLHPLSGLFSGLMKSAALELQDCLIYGVFTSAGDLPTGIAQAEDESEARHFLPL